MNQFTIARAGTRYGSGAGNLGAQLKAVAPGSSRKGKPHRGVSYLFQVGKRYEIRMIIGGEETMSWGTIERYEHPLLKFADVNIRPLESHLPDTTLHGEIINVTSPNFVSAVLVSH